MPKEKENAKRPVFYVEIHQSSRSYVYVEADSPEAAERLVWDEGPNHGWWDDRRERDDCDVECFGDMDEEPDLVAEKTAGCDVAFAVPEVIEGIVSSMVPIPGKAFKMGRFPVTQAQWEAVMGWNPSQCKGADRPVENVSWVNCRNFLTRLNALPAIKASGLTFRLPTKEEWEFACRAGSAGDYCKLADGTEIDAKTLGEVAWFDGNSGDETHPVGQKKPNAFGLYDMHGNVCEWTSTEDVDERHVYWFACGGCWFDLAEDCGSSGGTQARYSERETLGFRLCADRRPD